MITPFANNLSRTVQGQVDWATRGSVWGEAVLGSTGEWGVLTLACKCCLTILLHTDDSRDARMGEVSRSLIDRGGGLLAEGDLSSRGGGE